jgi:hypothetical protein
MAQLNIYLPPDDTLKERLDRAASALSTTPNALARSVVSELLETYVKVLSEVEDMKRQTFDELRETLEARAATLGKARFEESTESDDRFDTEDENPPVPALRQAIERHDGAVAR